MILVHWQPGYNTGIEVIDQQHRLLVDLINELYQASNNGTDRQILSKMINKLGVFAATHFGREEYYFDLHSYPDKDAHLKEHDYFEDKLLEFEDDFNAGKQNVTEKVLSFLSDWLVSHISNSDKSYVPFLKERGVK